MSRMRMPAERCRSVHSKTAGYQCAVQVQTNKGADIKHAQEDNTRR